MKIVLALAISVLAIGTQLGAASVEWDVPTFYRGHMQGIGTTLPKLAEDIQKISGGDIVFKVREPGQLLRSPKEILDAVSKGQVKAGYGASGFWQGKIPAAPLFTAVPFGPEAPEYLAWMYHGNGMKLYQEMYDSAEKNVKVLIAGISAPETSGWFRKEINSADDLQGMKMRIFGFGGQVMAKLGVAVTQMPGGEIYQALDRGVIDAAEFSTPAADADLGFYKVAKYNYFPGWHQQATLFELLINKAAWEKLTDAQRAQIEAACKSSVVDSLAYSEAIQAKRIKENVEKHGVEVKYWSQDMLDLFADTWEEVAEEASERDEFFEKVWDDLQGFRADYKNWSEVGFLPR